MRRALIQLSALVLLHHVPSVDVHGTVRVHGYHHLTNVAVDATLFEPTLQNNLVSIWKFPPFVCCIVVRSVLGVVREKARECMSERETTNNAFTCAYTENKEPQNRGQIMF